LRSVFEEIEVVWADQIMAVTANNLIDIGNTVLGIFYMNDVSAAGSTPVSV
jgi:hypothetical protein